MSKNPSLPSKLSTLLRDYGGCALCTEVSPDEVEVAIAEAYHAVEREKARLEDELEQERGYRLGDYEERRQLEEENAKLRAALREAQEALAGGTERGGVFWREKADAAIEKVLAENGGTPQYCRHDRWVKDPKGFTVCADCRCQYVE